ncbi:MAG: 30S ribosomal protein S6 [Bacteroidales bacterium]|nr:30S ribosomal protein S6 [Bacteroidales bacterium]
MNHYETVFIMTPVLSDDQMKEAVKKYQDLLKNQGAEIIHEENWGLKKLAYPIQKKASGFYYLMEFKADGKAVDTLETAYRRDERMLRFLTVKLDKFAKAYSEKRRTKNQ